MFQGVGSHLKKHFTLCPMFLSMVDYLNWMVSENILLIMVQWEMIGHRDSDR